MIGLKEGVVTQESQFYCYLGYATLTSQLINVIGISTPLDMPHGIQCPPPMLISITFLEEYPKPFIFKTPEAFDAWRNYILSFGFGEKLNSDFTNELAGNIPSSKYYDKIYGKNGWKSLTVISLAIGQGELGVTPLHLANFAATIANRGFYYVPHTVKKIEGLDTIEGRFTQQHFTAFDSTYFNVVVHGMELAVNGPNGGTANGAAVPGIIVCGKTGTAQNAGVEDHSIFIAFAPKDNPKIALSVYVENGGFGPILQSRWQA